MKNGTELSLEQKKLIQDYPLPVQFPGLAGPYFLLNWWTHNEQNHIILAKTLSALIAVFSALLRSERYDEAEPVALFRVDIVSPPEEMQIRAAESAHDEELDSFKRWASAAVQYLPELPDGFVRCTKFEPEDAEEEVDEWSRDRHYGCKNCHDGVVFALDLYEFYLKKRDEWRKNFRQNLFRDASRAEEASPNRELFAVIDRHGHHSDGSLLERIDSARFFGGSNVKFFCHAERVDIPSEILQLRKELDEKWRLRREDNERKQEEAQARAREETVNKLKKFFE